jgi:hypothetical protein
MLLHTAEQSEWAMMDNAGKFASVGISWTYNEVGLPLTQRNGARFTVVNGAHDLEVGDVLIWGNLKSEELITPIDLLEKDRPKGSPALSVGAKSMSYIYYGDKKSDGKNTCVNLFDVRDNSATAGGLGSSCPDIFTVDMPDANVLKLSAAHFLDMSAATPQVLSKYAECQQYARNLAKMSADSKSKISSTEQVAVGATSLSVYYDKLNDRNLTFNGSKAAFAIVAEESAVYRRLATIAGFGMKDESAEFDQKIFLKGLARAGATTSYGDELLGGDAQL